MSDVHAEACQVFEKLVTQIAACYSEFRSSASLGIVREMLLQGGASATPGLLRYLRYGR
jgi:hypothetical protein